VNCGKKGKEFLANLEDGFIMKSQTKNLRDVKQNICADSTKILSNSSLLPGKLVIHGG
jgi:hypothetical protein